MASTSSGSPSSELESRVDELSDEFLRGLVTFIDGDPPLLGEPRSEAQSTVIPSREYLVKGIETLRKRYPEAEDVPRPNTLKGIYLVPQCIEVWHGSEDRLHDRRLYTKEEEGWTEQFLVP